MNESKLTALKSVIETGPRFFVTVGADKSDAEIMVAGQYQRWVAGVLWPLIGDILAGAGAGDTITATIGDGSSGNQVGRDNTASDLNTH